MKDIIHVESNCDDLSIKRIPVPDHTNVEDFVDWFNNNGSEERLILIDGEYELQYLWSSESNEWRMTEDSKVWLELNVNIQVSFYIGEGLSVFNMDL